MLNAILYLAPTGYQWRILPKELPPRSTVQRYLYAWRSDGTLRTLAAAGQSAPEPALQRPAFDPVSGWHLEAGMTIAGPALIVEDQTTTVVSPTFDLSCHPFQLRNICSTKKYMHHVHNI